MMGLRPRLRASGRHGEAKRLCLAWAAIFAAIESGQLVTLSPVTWSDIRVGDVILVQWKNNYLLHLVLRIEQDQLLIGNNLGKVNGRVPVTAFLGKVTTIED